MYYISRISGTLALAALGVAVWFSVVLSRADFYFRQGNIQRAIEIAPRNTEYLAMRALQLDYEGADSRAVREKIAALNPYSSAPRIRLGLAAELAGDSAAAERWLLDAANIDHQFEPRWTLANFYFRAGKTDEFWKWMHAALEVSYGDRTPTYELCWRVSDDAPEIFRRAIPNRHEVIAGYLIYLSQTKKLAAMPEVARRLANFHEASDLPLLFGICDELLAAHDPAALDVWVFAGHPAPSEVFNGDFATPALADGFDWRFIESPGVTHSGNRIMLSGQQAAACLLLQQTLNLSAGKRYRISWDVKGPPGLEWRIGARHAPLQADEMTIVAPERFPVLQLAYQRPLGQPRAEGSVDLRRVRVEAVQ